MWRKRKTYKPKFCYGGYKKGEPGTPLVCVSVETMQLARTAIEAWRDLHCLAEKLQVRKHTCGTPCAHLHWVDSGQPPIAPVHPNARNEAKLTARLNLHQKILKQQHLD